MLKLSNVVSAYGKNLVLKNIGLEITRGEIVTIIGANGAGKSTTLKTIIGLLKPQSGSILFKGEEVAGFATENIVKKGIALCPEGRRIFADLTVLENLQIGAYSQTDKKVITETIAHNFELFPILKERSKQKGGTLSGGEQQMLAIARALMAKPEMLLLDEPSLGLAPLMVEKISQIIKQINEQGVSILLVEQNANMALHLSYRGYVLETGKIVLSGLSSELLNNPEIKAAYLGE